MGNTLTAWESEEAARNALSGDAHKEAMKASFAQHGLGVSAWTSWWSNGKSNARWQRCNDCGAFAKVDDNLQCGCGASLEEPPYF